MSGRTQPSDGATSTTTTTSEAMTKASVKVASGPLRARLRKDAERRRGAARDGERAPEQRDAEERPDGAATRAKGMSGRAARNSAVTSDEHEHALHEHRPRRGFAPSRRSVARSSSAPPASAMSDEGERVDRREVLDRVLVDEPQHVRSRGDPGEQVAR